MFVRGSIPVWLRSASLCSAMLCLATLCLAMLCLAVAGCSDKDHRLTPGELQAYKLELVRENRGKISPTHENWLLYQHPGRTKAELDSAAATFREQYSAQVSRERADFDESRPRSARQALGLDAKPAN